MQDMTSEICDSVVIGSPTTSDDIASNTLIDTRDKTTYLVAKYADGNCWMRQNLNMTLTADTAVTAYDFSTGETFSYTPAYTTQTETGTTWEQTASDGARSFNVNSDKYSVGTDINTAASLETSGQPYEQIGTLYNWAAATAQTGTAAAAATTEVSTSICPQGWRLPSNSGDYSFSELMGAYGLPTTNQSSLTSANNYSGQLQNPLNFNRPGYYAWSSGALGARGSRGYFWSSTAFNSTNARLLHFYSSGFNPQSGNSKGYGFSVRCVAV